MLVLGFMLVPEPMLAPDGRWLEVVCLVLGATLASTGSGGDTAAIATVDDK